MRYAYTPSTARPWTTLSGSWRRWVRALEDPVGTLVARNRPAGEKVFGVGSHCDSNRNGGKYDGTMGVVTALEVCRLNEELGLGLRPSTHLFSEERGGLGFGQMLLGSRIIAQRVTEEELRERFRAVDDGRSFWEHAEEAGYEPERWQDSIRMLDDLIGWIELHIEQARASGHAEPDRRGQRHSRLRSRRHHRPRARRSRRGDPMDFRQDAGIVMAECMLGAGAPREGGRRGTVGTVGRSSFGRTS